ncbi:hypothetical protein QJS10_CPB13g01038 [Acorus calamus]|uniref:Uncharacterized protein n=1 Tax=Acorus calamus TaxID=4465 RepID=A0AAV9DI17_ACOCL|nr:hypothetical protein QJS10_CPB13g01038 [Acorus calamus]
MKLIDDLSDSDKNWAETPSSPIVKSGPSIADASQLPEAEEHSEEDLEPIFQLGFSDPMVMENSSSEARHDRDVAIGLIQSLILEKDRALAGAISTSETGPTYDQVVGDVTRSHRAREKPETALKATLEGHSWVVEKFKKDLLELSGALEKERAERARIASRAALKRGYRKGYRDCQDGAPEPGLEQVIQVLEPQILESDEHRVRSNPSSSPRPMDVSDQVTSFLDCTLSDIIDVYEFPSPGYPDNSAAMKLVVAVFQE